MPPGNPHHQGNPHHRATMPDWPNFSLGLSASFQLPSKSLPVTPVTLKSHCIAAEGKDHHERNI